MTDEAKSEPLLSSRPSSPKPGPYGATDMHTHGTMDAEAATVPLADAVDAVRPSSRTLATSTGPVRELQRSLPVVSRMTRHPYARASKIVLLCVYAIVAALAGVVIWQLVARRSERHVVAWAVSAIFVGLSVPLCLHEIHMHMWAYVRPSLQRHYIRIIAMVPIYAIESWFALRFKEQAVYLEVAREAYEAYVIYSFFKLLSEFLGGEPAITARISSRGRPITLMFPCCCVRWRADATFYSRTAMGTFQYVLIRVLLAVVTFVCQLTDTYGEGEWSHADKAYVYVTVILNLSQAWAMYCLVLFYHELKHDLSPLHPLGKFLVVKAVVFFSFWQQIVLSLLEYYGVLQPTLDYTQTDVAKGLQDFAICIEMLFAAFAHVVFFSHKDFKVSKDHPMAPDPDAVMAIRSASHTGIVRATLELLPADMVVDARKHLDDHVVKPLKMLSPKPVAIATAYAETDNSVAVSLRTQSSGDAATEWK